MIKTDNIKPKIQLARQVNDGVHLVHRVSLTTIMLDGLDGL